MAQKTLKISLVGMRFHSPPFDVGVEIKKTPPTLQHEPNNKHDEHAVAVLLRNHKVGYVDKESAFRVANILRMKANYQVNVKSISSTTINLDFIYEVKEKAPDAPKLSITNKTGIYKISVNDDERVYVGQSNSINERLKTHWNDLAQYSHPNKHLQRNWNEYGENKFKASILELAPEHIKPGLELQRWLAEREKHWIQYYRNKTTCLNITDGEVIPTKKAVDEFAKEQKAYDQNIKLQKKIIKAEIEDKQKRCSESVANLRSIEQQVEGINSFLFANTGIIGFVIGSSSKLQIEKKRKELDALLPRLHALRSEVNAKLEEINQLKKKHRGLKTIKQLENLVGSQFIKIGKSPPSLRKIN